MKGCWLEETPGCPVPGSIAERFFFLLSSLGHLEKRALGPLLSLQMQTNGSLTALVLSKQKACHLSPRFIDSVSPISSNGYHREWLGETWSHNEDQIITTSSKFAWALSLSGSAFPNSSPVRLSLYEKNYSEEKADEKTSLKWRKALMCLFDWTPVEW